MLTDKIKYNKDKLGRIDSVQVPIELWDELISSYDIPDSHKFMLDEIDKNIKNGKEQLFSDSEIDLDKL